jgi:hypothetical protein
MLRILERKWTKTGSSNSRLKFDSKLGAAGIGLRYLMLDGERAYNLGSNCQTCSFLFERLPGANKSVEIQDTADALRRGVNSLNEDVVNIIGLGLPEGEYLLALAETSVKLVRPGESDDYFAGEQIALWGEDNFWCLPHDPRVPYYRGGARDLGEGRKLFNFVVPMFPTKWLTFRAVSQYVAELSAKGSGTAVSLTVLDVKGPALWKGEPQPDPSEHWCLTHYIVDGHHKLHAASEARQPLRLLSFVALSQGVSTREEVEEAVSICM